MSEAREFDELMDLLASGDEDAAREVFLRFSSRLIAVTRNRLDKRILQKIDPEDVTQSVFRSFFARQANGSFELAS